MISLPTAVGVTILGLIVVAAWHSMQRRLDQAQQRIDNLRGKLAAGVSNEGYLKSMMALTESAYNALVIADDHMRVLYLNSAAQDLFGAKEVSFNDSHTSVMAVTRQHELDYLIKRTLEEQDELVEQVQINGCAYRVKVTCSKSNGGQIVAMALEDISELQRLGRSRRDMVANISHELRTPITSIKLLADTLLRSHKLGKHELKLVKKITAELDILQQIAQELLDLSMIESGRVEMVFIPVALHEIVEHAAEMSSERAHHKHITITTDVSPEIDVLADPEHVGRVLRNLMHNSIKFTPEGGSIHVMASEWNGFAIVTVNDTGMGIPSDERERIFERFFRGDRARHSEGTGLGLAIAKHIVTAHGGIIRAVAPPNGIGASIEFTLPLLEEPEAAKN